MTTPPPTPPPVSGATLAIGAERACGTTPSGATYCWGMDDADANNIPFAFHPRPARVEGIPPLSRLSVASGWAFTCGVTEAGVPWCWRGHARERRPDGSEVLRVEAYTLEGGAVVKQLDAGQWHTCALTPLGKAICWGSNRFGQLGADVGDTRERAPVEVNTSQTFVAISAGSHHTCALTSAGKAWCWGFNNTGQLGDGTNVERNRPVEVQGGPPFSKISAGSYHTCALTAEGRAYCWGSNWAGQAGQGAPTDNPLLMPIPVAGGLVFSEISGGGFFTCGLTPAGEAYCWGDATGGKLGDGTLRASAVPVPVAGGLRFRSIATGQNQAIAVTASGDAYAWGTNTYGTLGDGSLVGSSTPVAVSGGLRFR
ncbi:MAG TPA: hypothetical protein VFV33_01420 [Gemmatimonadaceae bacterium]|nr:hypothetical protein [Gemmatimonadaceae bacterium]